MPAPELTLVIGDKNVSSWSLRPWLLLKEFGIPFREETIRLRQSDTKARILTFGGGATVPILKDDELVIWESLAIAEYLAERYPQKALWPRDRAARAYARAMASEMHSGFTALRTVCPMTLNARMEGFDPVMDVARDIARIETIWREARTRFGQAGSFLFGDFSIADAFFAPVVTRFRTYGIKLSPMSAAYCATILATNGMKEWERGARDQLKIESGAI